MMRTILFWVSSLAVLAFLIAIPVRNERIVNAQDKLFVELVPVDPRSLMQGDYMRLAYTLERNRILPDVLVERSMVVAGDAHSVAQFVRFHDTTKPLGTHERLLHFRKQHNSIEITPRSFFFQEGQASVFEAAKYGIFSYGSSGEYLLTGLADKDRKRIVDKINP